MLCQSCKNRSQDVLQLCMSVIRDLLCAISSHLVVVLELCEQRQKLLHCNKMAIQFGDVKAYYMFLSRIH